MTDPRHHKQQRGAQNAPGQKPVDAPIPEPEEPPGLGMRIAMGLTSGVIGGAVGGIVLALLVGSFFPKLHLITGWWVCKSDEKMYAGTERGGVDENYVVCEHNETRGERDVEGKAFWALSAMLGGTIALIVLYFTVRPKKPEPRSPEHQKRPPPKEGSVAVEKPDDSTENPVGRAPPDEEPVEPDLVELLADEASDDKNSQA